MKPNSEGIWEWFDTDNNLHLVDVVNIETNPNYPQILRVPWLGGYYRVHDETEDTAHTQLAEWPDRWGRRRGDRTCVTQEELYNQ